MVKDTKLDEKDSDEAFIHEVKLDVSSSWWNTERVNVKRSQTRNWLHAFVFLKTPTTHHWVSVVRWVWIVSVSGTMGSYQRAFARFTIKSPSSCSVVPFVVNTPQAKQQANDVKQTQTWRSQSQLFYQPHSHWLNEHIKCFERFIDTVKTWGIDHIWY